MHKKTDHNVSKRKIRNNRLAAAGIVFVFCGALSAGLYFTGTAPLDQLNVYEVHVSPREDGTLNISYRYEWKVLNSTREGPLTWVRLGMANEAFKVLETGGAISGIRPVSAHSGTWASFNLDRQYLKGQTAQFGFTVNQRRMLCSGQGPLDQPFYDFTPGWFGNMDTKYYRFTWTDSPYILEHNATKREFGLLIWEGSLPRGQGRQMKVSYDSAAFSKTAEQVQWQPCKAPAKEQPQPGNVCYFFMIAGILFPVLLVVFAFSGNSDSGYNNGTGFHRNWGHRDGGGGGGCACACAGCACACACAGGGRAGCGRKDFTIANPSKTLEPAS